MSTFLLNGYYTLNDPLKKYVNIKLTVNKSIHRYKKKIRNYKYKNYDRIISRSHKPEIENLFDASYREELYMSFFYKINNRYPFICFKNP